MFLLKIGQKLIMPLMIIVSILLIVILQLGFIFLLIALLPSIAAYFVDDDSELTAFRTIFACNLAAALPTLTPIFVYGLELKHYEINSVISDPKVFLFIYSGAGIGWCIIHFGSQVARAILEIQYKFRSAHLEKVQSKLLEEWGDTVKQLIETKPKDKNK